MYVCVSYLPELARQPKLYSWYVYALNVHFLDAIYFGLALFIPIVQRIINSHAALSIE